MPAVPPLDGTPRRVPPQIEWDVPAKATLAGLERGDFPDADWPTGATAKEAIKLLADRYRRGEPVRPLLARQHPDGRVTLLVGQLRYAACMLAGVTTIPAYVLAHTLPLAEIEHTLARIRAHERGGIPNDIPPQDGQHREGDR